MTHQRSPSKERNPASKQLLGCRSCCAQHTPMCPILHQTMVLKHASFPASRPCSLPGKFHLLPPSPTAESQLQDSASVSICHKGFPDFLLDSSSPVSHALKKKSHCSLLSVVVTAFMSASGLQSLEECLIICGRISIKWLSN